ncbi:hypothetical protein ILYODFUR_017190, partial [Ilyodon furcidens]
PELILKTRTADVPDRSSVNVLQSEWSFSPHQHTDSQKQPWRQDAANLAVMPCVPIQLNHLSDFQL